MSLKTLTSKVTNKVGRQVLTAKKHSPVIFFSAGIAGMVTTVVLASKATLKMDEVLKEAEADRAKIDEASKSEKYSDEDRQKDSALARVKLAVNIGKLYAPAAIAGVASVACLTGSHVILTKRNAGLTAAYVAVDKAFKEYRGRVVNELGAEKDAEFRFGTIEKEIAVETDHGTDVKTVKALDISKGVSQYAKYFDEMNPNFRKGHHLNQFFIQAQQNYANDKLRARGHLFLNEVYEMLGFEHTKAGAVVGWVMGNGDDKVDFGVFRGDVFNGQAFANGEMNEVLLDFNVDGVVYDLLGD
ncbi:membrane protein [Streptomyces phage RosaAsantewaa]|nr:membrane protein [Streptomyces phage RosaAsantewaa]